MNSAALWKSASAPSQSACCAFCCPAMTAAIDPWTAGSVGNNFVKMKEASKIAPTMPTTVRVVRRNCFVRRALSSSSRYPPVGSRVCRHTSHDAGRPARPPPTARGGGSGRWCAGWPGASPSGPPPARKSTPAASSCGHRRGDAIHVVQQDLPPPRLCRAVTPPAAPSRPAGARSSSAGVI